MWLLLIILCIFAMFFQPDCQETLKTKTLMSPHTPHYAFPVETAKHIFICDDTTRKIKI